MKKIFPVLLMLVISMSAFAQGTMTEGYIKMEVTDVSSNNEEATAGLEMLKGSETNYYFNKDQSLVKTSVMGGMVENSSLMDHKTKKTKMFFNMMGQKSLVETSEDEMKALQGGQDEAMKTMKVDYDKSDTKDILGYKCYKATISNPEMGSSEELPAGFSFVCYISEDIKADASMIKGLDGFNLDGFPLEFIIDMGMMKMVYTTTEIEKEVDASVFSVDETGYTKMTFEEFQKNMGQMGGGGIGF